MRRTGWNATPILVERPGRPTPGFVRAVRRYLAPVVRLLHRPTLEGAEHLPTDGAFLLVANHSAGLGLSEIGAFMCLYLEQVGPDRPLAGFAHPLGIRFFPSSVVLRAAGAIPSTYASAARTLAAGVPVLVFPGGDHEALRPIWQAHQVDFGGRVGFLRIAREAGVPIVPMGIRGSHATAPILWRSRALATFFVLPRLAGVKRWALTVLGVAGAAAIVTYGPASWLARIALAWAWMATPLVFLPWVPATIRMRIGPPLAARDLFPGPATDAELTRALVRVEAAVQRLVDGGVDTAPDGSVSAPRGERRMP